MGNIVSTFFFLIILALTLSEVGCAQDVPNTPQSQPATKKGNPKPDPTATPKLPPDLNKYAVIISGLGGEETYSKQFSDWTNALRGALIGQLGFADEQIKVLIEKP